MNPPFREPGLHSRRESGDLLQERLQSVLQTEQLLPQMGPCRNLPPKTTRFRHQTLRCSFARRLQQLSHQWQDRVARCYCDQAWRTLRPQVAVSGEMIPRWQSAQDFLAPTQKERQM